MYPFWPDRGLDIGTPDVQLFLLCLDRADGRVLVPDTVQVSCCQWRMACAYLCHHVTLVSGPIPLPMLVAVLTSCDLGLALLLGPGFC